MAQEECAFACKPGGVRHRYAWSVEATSSTAAADAVAAAPGAEIPAPGAEVAPAHTDALPDTPDTGLTSSEVVQRRAQGLGNDVDWHSSRGYAQILRENVFTFINIILF